ncbi:hypothetical protein OROHE_023887 [Orobanche hederae]
MAGGGNFGFRVFSYLINEVVVNGLANRCLPMMTSILRFQRFAVRTSKKLEDLTDIAAQKKKELAEQMKDISQKFDPFKNR